MSHAVVDSSVLVNLLVDERWGGGPERVLGSARLAAPAHFDAEALNAFRGLSRRGNLSDQKAAEARASLFEFPLARMPIEPLAEGAWSLRDNLTMHDALYVALAQVLECELITADRGIAVAPSTGITIRLIR